MIEVAAAALCLGIGFLMRFSSISKKMTSEILGAATLVKDLKGLGECIEKIKYPTVVVRGTVGSNSTVENSRLDVFVRETASLEFERHLFSSTVADSESILVSLKEVPWYLDDGTARVYVSDYQYAKGFYDTLKNYFSTEPAIKYFESLVSDEKIKITDFNCRKRRQVLEIGTNLTVVGSAVRDKDGVPMIGKAYEVFSGHIQLEDLVKDLKSESERFGTLSFCLTALGVVLLGVSIMQTDVYVIE